MPAATSALRAELRALTAQLRALGVSLSYTEAAVDSGSPATLRSCIVWARGTLEHVRAVRSAA